MKLLENKISPSDVYDTNGKTGALILGKNRLDDYAMKYLASRCPEALKTPMPLPVDEIIQNEGLTVQHISLSKNLDIFGCCVLIDGYAEVYDRKKDEYRPKKFPAGTILIDPESEWAYGEGAKRNTLIHEAIHWEKDKVYFTLLENSRIDENEKIYPIMCRQSKTFYEPPEGKKTKDNQIHWLEWQANRLAPRILMPRDSFRKKALEYISEANETFLCDILIEKLSEFFIVSRESVKYRLLEVGLEDKISKFSDYVDVYDSINNKREYVPMALAEAWDLLRKNPAINDWVSEQRMIFVDGYFVLPSAKYVRHKNGALHLTSTAKKSLSKCALNVREQKYTEYRNAGKDLDGCAVLFRVDGISRNLLVCNKKIQYDFKVLDKRRNYTPDEVFDDAYDELKLLDDEDTEKELERKIGDPDATLCQCISFLMEKRKWISAATFADKTLLHENYFYGIKNDKRNSMTKPILMAVCVGLQLTIDVTQKLFRKAGLILNRFQPPDSKYIAIMRRFPCINIIEFNELLERDGVKALGSKER